MLRLRYDRGRDEPSRLLLFPGGGLVGARVSTAADERPIAIGGRRELLVDDFLIDRFEGDCRLRMHHPERQEIALEHDEPWKAPAAATTLCSRTAGSTGCTTSPGTIRSTRLRRTR